MGCVTNKAEGAKQVGRDAGEAGQVQRKPQKKKTTVTDAPMLLGKDSSGEKPASNTKSDHTLKSIATSRSSHRSSRQGTLYRQRTTALSVVDMNDLDVMVLSYSCFNENSKKSLGPDCYEATWKVRVGQNPTPIVIQVHVDRSNPGVPNVRITSDGECIFPKDSTCEMAKIRGDFQHKWHFTGSIEGMHETNHFEILTTLSQEWLPATMLCETPEGCYDMVAEMPDSQGGFKYVVFPGVSKGDIRYASSHKIPEARERFLMLEVPAQDPANAVLSVDDCELVTLYFARPSPAPGGPCRSLHLQVSQDRTEVLANMSHLALTDFMKSEVRAVDDVWHYQAQDVLKRSWIIQLGHFAEHSIQLEKSQLENSHYRLLVDGDTVVAASLDDLDCDDDTWECTFHLVGERSVEFDVYEMDEVGSSSASVGRIVQKHKYSHECRVTVQHVHDDEKIIELIVDDKNYNALPHLPASKDETLVRVTVEELKASYGIDVPHKVARRSVVDIDDNNNLRSSSRASKKFRNEGGSLWLSCCNQSVVDVDIADRRVKMILC